MKVNENYRNDNKHYKIKHITDFKGPTLKSKWM